MLKTSGETSYYSRFVFTSVTRSKREGDRGFQFRAKDFHFLYDVMAAFLFLTGDFFFINLMLFKKFLRWDNILLHVLYCTAKGVY